MTVHKRMTVRRGPTVLERQMKAMASKGFITVDEAAQRAKVPRGTMYRWTLEGRLTIERVGPRRIYVNLESLRALVGAIMDET